MPARLFFGVVLMVCAASCTPLASSRDNATAASNLPRFPACDAEIKAFVALAKLAKQLGDDWQVYEPALTAMQDQIIECVDDNYPDPIGI